MKRRRTPRSSVTTLCKSQPPMLACAGRKKTILDGGGERERGGFIHCRSVAGCASKRKRLYTVKVRGLSPMGGTVRGDLHNSSSSVGWRGK